jgi:hypothetical protein
VRGVREPCDAGTAACCPVDDIRLIGQDVHDPAYINRNSCTR